MKREHVRLDLEPDEKPIEIDTETADGIFIKQIIVPKENTVIPQHSHVWDHSTILAKGAMYVWKDDVLDRQYRAPSIIFIPKGVKHLFLTLTDNTLFYCVHNLKSAEAVEILAEHNLLDEVA